MLYTRMTHVNLVKVCQTLNLNFIQAALQVRALRKTHLLDLSAHNTVFLAPNPGYFRHTKTMPSSSSSSSSSSSAASIVYPTLHLRAEVKPYEHRSCLSPNIAQALIEAGYPLNVERSSTNPDYTRIFHDDEYSAVGAKLVPEGSWVDAPTDKTIIIGLKELPEEDTFPLRHVMVHFAHCYKEQTGWQKVLKRFIEGGGVLYDLEFLEDESGRRVAAFGFHAGFAGAALALKNWCWQFIHPDKPSLPSVQAFTNGRGYYENIGELIQQLRTDMHHPNVIGHIPPRVMVLGAKGRCGRGAVDLLKKAGVASENIIQWDIEETKDRNGPYPEIIESDIFINTIYLTKKIPPFVTKETIDDSSRKLRVVCDVSCDPNSPNNPIPIYNRLTYFNNPTFQVIPSTDATGTTSTANSPAGPPLSLIAIDHLPSLLPREASEAFGKDLLPSLLLLKDREKAGVWTRAEGVFHEKCGKAAGS